MTPVQFTVIDQVDPAEISEDTILTIGGREVARFRLDRTHPEGRVQVSLPAAPSYDYALCGRITLQRDTGQEQRVVAGGGTLVDPDGQVFQALAGGDFRVFYLAPAGAPGAPPPDARAKTACDLPTS